MKLRPFAILCLLFIGGYLSSCTSDPKANASEKVTPEESPAIPLIASLGEQPLTPQDPFVRRYTGMIEGNAPVDIQLINWGDGFLSGKRVDPTTGKTTDLQGEMNLDETVILQAFPEGNPGEKFTFPFTDLNKITGEWQPTDASKAHSFELEAITSSHPPKSWEGTWYLNGIWEGGQLIIGDVRDTAFYFALSIVRNGHSGIGEGEARITGDSAAFTALVEEAFDDEVCDLHFRLQEEYIEVDQRSSTSACGFGMRAYSNGNYDNKKVKREPELPYGEGETIFKDEAQHQAFKNWIGEDNYIKIARNMQIFDNAPYFNRSEKLTGKFTQGLVLGLLTSNEAAILHDDKEGFWAATIDINEEDPSTAVIRYFSNQKFWQDKMPQAFEEWRKSFSDYPVIYSSLK